MNYTYYLCKTVITRDVANGTINVEEMKKKLDVFLLGERITDAEYQELMGLMTPTA